MSKYHDVSKVDHITINWHIIEKCNYTCDYCFAKYDKPLKKEIHSSQENIVRLLNKVYLYFSAKYEGFKIILNVAGGEPTLSGNLDFIIKKAYEIGFHVSIITNLSKITSTFIESNVKYLSIFATSIDSLDNSTNIKIGRSSNNKALCKEKIIQVINQVREEKNNIEIKINTVVNEYNYEEYLGDFIALIRPIKWKIFQALSINKNRIYCTSQQFNIFLDRNKSMNSKIYEESNDDMIDSYIMIDPYGRFYQNTDGEYIYSKSIIGCSVENAFKSINFNFNKFSKRY